MESPALPSFPHVTRPLHRLSSLGVNAASLETNGSGGLPDGPLSAGKGSNGGKRHSGEEARDAVPALANDRGMGAERERASGGLFHRAAVTAAAQAAQNNYQQQNQANMPMASVLADRRASDSGSFGYGGLPPPAFGAAAHASGRFSNSGSFAGARVGRGSASGWEHETVASRGGISSLSNSRRPSETGNMVGGSGVASRRGSEFGQQPFGGRTSEFGAGFGSRLASMDGSVFMFNDGDGNGGNGKVPFSVSRMIGAGPLLPLLPALYVAGFVLLELYCSAVHPLLLGTQLPFVPLMLTSMYCALGVGWVWLRLTWGFVTGRGYC